MSAEWDAAASAFATAMTILFLLRKKSWRKKKPAKTKQNRRRPSARRDEQVEFEREYDPIEPS